MQIKILKKKSIENEIVGSLYRQSGQNIEDFLKAYQSVMANGKNETDHLPEDSTGYMPEGDNDESSTQQQ